jgi:dipeptidase E
MNKTQGGVMRKLLWLFALLPLAAGARDGSEMKLYLTSAGINVLDELVLLLPFPARDHVVCYITTAGGSETVPPWMNDEIEAIEKTGLGVRRIDLARLSASDMADTFQGCHAIWVGGGNTYYLLQQVRRSGFDEYVVARIAEGLPYIGTSAGSLLLAPNIECIKYAEDPDSQFAMESYDGLDVFPLATFVHFDNPDFRDAYRQIVIDALENDVAFVTLRDNQFLFVDGESWRIIDAN